MRVTESRVRAAFALGQGFVFSARPNLGKLDISVCGVYLISFRF